MSILARVLLRHSDGSRTPVDPQDVYLVEADGGEVRIRTRNAEPLVDVRPLGELVSLFSEHGFVRIHRSFIVNIARVRHIRPRECEGWELKLDPPVNRVLPVAEGRAADLWAAFGGD
jgi:DNA-binding LytR/AlgR family response regulator